MYGKAIVHMIRISSIISCLHNAFNIIMKLDVPNKIMLQKEIDLKLTDQFKSFKDTYVVFYIKSINSCRISGEF